MSKYSYEFKLKVINDMLDNHVGIDRAAKKVWHFSRKSKKVV